MASVHLDGRAITDWPSFHRASRLAFGFPDFYGNNMDAWIDCLSSLREPGSGMTSIVLAPDETLQINVDHGGALRKKAPHIAAALEECTTEVNARYAEYGEKPALLLVFR